MPELRVCSHGMHHPFPDNLDYPHSCDGCWCEGLRDHRDYGWDQDTTPTERSKGMTDPEHHPALAAGMREYPPSELVKDPFGETGWAQTDPYGHNEDMRNAFIKGWKARAEQVPSPEDVVDAVVSVMITRVGREEMVTAVTELLRPKEA